MQAFKDLSKKSKASLMKLQLCMCSKLALTEQDILLFHIQPMQMKKRIQNAKDGFTMAWGWLIKEMMHWLDMLIQLLQSEEVQMTAFKKMQDLTFKLICAKNIFHHTLEKKQSNIGKAKNIHFQKTLCLNLRMLHLKKKEKLILQAS